MINFLTSQLLISLCTVMIEAIREHDTGRTNRKGGGTSVDPAEKFVKMRQPQLSDAQSKSTQVSYDFDGAKGKGQ